MWGKTILSKKLIEPDAITQYLDNLDGKPILTGKTAREGAIIQMMQKRAEFEILDAVGYYFRLTSSAAKDLRELRS